MFQLKPNSNVNVGKELCIYKCFIFLGKLKLMCYLFQLIMSRRRIPCLDSYLDKVSFLGSA